MKVTKRIPSRGQIVLRISVGRETVYISGFENENQARMTEVGIINAQGFITGHVLLSHLDRLGNANGAKSDPMDTRGQHLKAFHNEDQRKTLEAYKEQA